MKVSPTNNEELIQDQQTPEDSSASDIQDTENAEDSSASETSEEELSTYDVVKQALNTKEDDSEDKTEDSSEEEGSDKSEDNSKEEDEDETEKSDEEPSEEELKAWKPKTRKRFKDLQSKYRTVSDENNSLKEKLTQAEVEAGHYRQFEGFLRENRINEKEANELFNIGALMKNDPMKALELITPHYNMLLQMTGNVLPQNLQQQVDQGYLTREHAMRIARLEANNQTSQVIQQDRQQYQQQQEIERQTQLTNDIQGGISQWEQDWSKNDPDYTMKKQKVLDRVELELSRAVKTGNLPRSRDEAVRLAEKARKDVEAEITKYRPKKPAINTVQGGGNTSKMPEPTSTLDVIRRTVGS